MRRPFLLLLVLTGCYDGFTTDGEELRLDPDDLQVDPLDGFYPDRHAVLEGSQICVSVHCGGADPTCPASPSDCFDDRATGALVEGGAPFCVVADTPGEGTWHFDPVDCEANAEGYLPQADQTTLTVVDAATTTASLDQWVERILPELAVPHAGRAFPDDWTTTDATFRVVADGWLQLPVRLAHPDSDWVAWNDSRAELTLVPDSGESHVAQRPDPAHVLLSPEPGTASDLVLALPEGDWVVARILGVPDRPGSLELVGAIVADEDGFTTPAGARAVLRDRDGNLLYGARVTWEVLDGDLAIAPGDTLPGPDYAMFHDDCVPPSERGGPRQATVQASHGELSDTIQLSWEAEPSSVLDEDWTPHEACQHGASGCGCATGAPPPPWLAVPTGLLALLARRRQSRVTDRSELPR